MSKKGERKEVRADNYEIVVRYKTRKVIQGSIRIQSQRL